MKQMDKEVVDAIKEKARAEVLRELIEYGAKKWPRDSATPAMRRWWDDLVYKAEALSKTMPDKE